MCPRDDLSGKYFTKCSAKHAESFELNYEIEKHI